MKQWAKTKKTKKKNHFRAEYSKKNKTRNGYSKRVESANKHKLKLSGLHSLLRRND